MYFVAIANAAIGITKASASLGSVCDCNTSAVLSAPPKITSGGAALAPIPTTPIERSSI